jgi:hypothetical protein
VALLLSSRLTACPFRLYADGGQAYSPSFSNKSLSLSLVLSSILLLLLLSLLLLLLLLLSLLLSLLSLSLLCCADSGSVSVLSP